MNPTSQLGVANFLAQADGLALALLGVLLAMSVATWTLIVMRWLGARGERRRTAQFLARHGEADSVETIVAHVDGAGADEPFSRLAARALATYRHHRNATEESAAAFVERALRRAIDEETTRRETGLTVLASVGSTAPFVGLFGTVWGVYHALINIGASGQGSLDQVAGPVGEALLMTAFGLAVAIPAVLAYNACVRGNRVLLACLDGYAHDLYALLTTGARVQPAKAA